MTDPIADMIVRLKNANLVFKPYVDVPWSKFKENILNILKEERYIKNWELIEDKNKKILRVHLLYIGKRPAILRVKRASKPGRRLYVSKEEFTKKKQDSGIAILTTSKGIMSDRKARELKIGGEVLFYIW
ncbi:MAG: 30S ribosomal protein S8 [bacterium]|nr:30S ribosomal protein S8 [bacterium]